MMTDDGQPQPPPTGWREEARIINEALHYWAGAEPCWTACTHVVGGRWTILGIANVAARNGGPTEMDV